MPQNEPSWINIELSAFRQSEEATFNKWNWGHKCWVTELKEASSDHQITSNSLSFWVKRKRSRRYFICFCLVLFSKLCITSLDKPIHQSICAVRQFCNNIKFGVLSNRWSVLESHMISGSSNIQMALCNVWTDYIVPKLNFPNHITFLVLLALWGMGQNDQFKHLITQF